MRSAHSGLTRHNSVALILCLTALIILMASALSVSPSSSIASSSMASSARVEASGIPAPGEPIARTLASPSLLAPGSPNITATKTDSPGTPANPGDTITYTVVISNTTGTADATGVMFNDTIDTNTTFVNGSINVSPIAVNDTYNTIGNVNISVPAGTGLLFNDLNPGGMGTLGFTLINATSFVSGTPVATTHGSVTVNTDGSFTYNPNAGFAGPSDSFTYTLGNGTGLTDTATVTINIAGMIWFVNNDPGAPGSAPGDGRLTNPFRSFGGASSFNTLATDAAGDAIFIYTGTSNYTGGVTLLNNQKLIGQGAGASILSITGFSTPSGANLLPNTGLTNPTIAAAVDNITLGSGNTVRGVTLNVTAVGATALTGSGFGTLTLAETTIGGTNGGALSLTTGTLTGPVASTAAFTSISSTNSSLTGITLTSVGGAMSSGSTTVTNPTGIGLSVNTSSAAFNFATTSVTGSGGTGVSLLTNTGTITFAGLTITPDSGQRGLLATNNTNTITTTSGTISTTTGVAVEITRSSSTTPLSVALTSVSSNGATSGIVLTNTSGSFSVAGTGSAGTGGTIQNSTAAGINLNVVSNLSLSFMSITTGSFEGIAGTDVNGFTLTSCSVTNNSIGAHSGNNRNGIILTDTSGTVAFMSDTVTGNQNFNVELKASANLSRTISTLTVNGGSYSNSVLNGGFLIDLRNTPGITTKVGAAFFTGATFSNNFSKGVQFQTNNDSTIGDSSTAALGSWSPAPPAGSLTVTNCTFSANNVAASFESGGGAGSPNVYYRMVNNGSAGSPILGIPITTPGTGSSHTIIFANTAENDGGTYKGLCSGNFVGNAAVSGSGSGKGNGFRGFFQGKQTVTMTITNNTIRACPNGRGIDVEELGRVGANQGQTAIDIKITGNDVNPQDSTGFPPYAIYVAADAQGTGTSGSNVHAEIHGNTVPSNSACDTQCSASTGMIDYETVSGATGTTTGTLFNFGGNATVSSEIANTNTGTSGKTCSFVNGGSLTLTATPVMTVTSARPDLTTESAGGAAAGQTDVGAAGSTSPSDILLAARGEAPKDDSTKKLTQAELNWMVQAAIERWRQTGVSSEDLARLQAVTFEITDLPNGQIATATSSNIKIDETAAGYGWFFDQTPNEDSEFDVPVPGKEFQTTEYSPAHGRMDLLTVVMRELGTVYLQGKRHVSKSERKKLQPLMESTLSPSVRRLPDLSLAQMPSPQSEVQSTPETAAGSVASSSASSSSMGGGKRSVHTSSAVTVQSTSFPLSLGTIPVGEQVTIKFQVTVNAKNTLPAGLTQVCNQGTVTGTNFTLVNGVSTTPNTDDPSVGGATDPTCTQLVRADVSMTKSAGGSSACSTSNITYTIGYNNAGPSAAANVVVSDAMPVGTSLVSVTTPATWSRTDLVPTGGNGTITFSKASSANADTASFTVVVSIDGTVADGAVLSNTANVTTDTYDPNLTNNTSSPATTVTVKKPPTTATVGGPQTICALGTTASLGGNTPTIGTGTWTVQSGGTGTFNPSATTPGATFTHATGTGPVVVRWTISNPPCADSFAEVTVTVKQQPTATAGGPQTICQGGTTASLGGNIPSGGATGTWSIVTGGVTGTFNPNATTPGATFTHSSGGIGSTITLRWTVSNPPCSDATADVAVTIKSQPTASAGGPQTICSGGTTAGLGGNTPNVGETGTWSIVTAGITGTFNPNANTPGATFTHSTGSTSPFTLRWTVSNPPCTAATADVTITLQPAPISTNGGPQTICDGGTTAGLGGNNPAVGETGQWSIVTGGATGTFAPNATTPNATFTPTSGPGTITLRWTVSNATCGANATSDAVITVKQQPTATVGGPQTICALGTTASLGGNTPSGGATGMWSIVTGGATGTFNPNATTPGATFTHATGTGMITLRWTVSNAPCTSATADVVITINQPPTTATVGGPQTICNGSTTASLGGNTPTSGTGMWTIQTGGATGTFNPNAATPGATFTPTSGAGTIVVRWTISNPPCSDSFAEVTITVKLQPTATVGGPQSICAGGTTASLGGNTPAGGATGTWSIVTVGATGTFNPNANTPGATFTHSTGTGMITLRWTVSNPPCSDATADVVITINQSPTTATVGGPQTICALGTTAGLGGNTPASGTGTWTVQSGGTGTFNPNANTPGATFTHTSGVGPIKLRWTISNPPCTDSFAEVTITINQPPTTATVGGPQTICDGSSTAGLGGDTPTSGTGTWSIQSGGTGTFNPNANTPNATFTPTGGPGTYTVRWTISDPPCPDSFAEVTVTVKQQPTATTGGPQTICAGSTSASLGGNTPAGGATGTWSIVTAGATGTFNPNANTPGATFTHTGGTGTIALRWTVSNPPCTNATADVVLTIKQPPTTATVGPNQTISPGGTTAPLGGNTPTSGTGTWTIATAGFTGIFNPNASTPNATWTHVSGSGQVKLRWTISNPPCPDSFAEVTVQIGVAPTITCPNNIMVNNDPNQCSASVQFTVGSTGIPAPTVTCKVGNTVITSPNTFPVGTTTVNCTASNGVQPDAMCSFTVTVKDTQPPVFPNGCPANVTATASASCPFAAGKVVTFTTPAVSDNCPGATVACNPPSGSTFPPGTTTVTCTATDASNNMAQCTFPVTVFPMCLQDETIQGNFVLFNPLTGDFQFFCNGVLIASGTGTPHIQGCGGTINQAKGDRRVEIAFDTTANGGKGSGTATLSNPPSTVRCQILDKDMSNNTCSAPGPVAAPERGRERVREP